MKRFSLLLLAASSVAWSVVAIAATRPHYGGTLRIAVREAPQTIDPVDLARAGASSVSHLIFDTLVVVDDRGKPKPSLAASWQAEPGNQRWHVSLRSGVLFSDGTPLSATAVAASLRSTNPDWKVLTTGDTVIIENASPEPELPAELALARNAILRHDGQQTMGTGPFSVSQWVPGKHLTLTANDRYWSGRPFVDAIEIDFGRNDRDQLSSLDLGKVDIVEVAPENIRRARAEGRSVVASNPSELLALVFPAPSKSEEETHARNALALSLDTTAINNVVLQGGGEPAGSPLPNWLSGYSFVFSSQTNLDRARQERSQAKQAVFVLGYNSLDPLAHTIAERVLLNARDAGITLQLTTAGHSDLQLVRIPLASCDAQVSLDELANALQLPVPKFTNDSVTELYAAERTLLQSQRVIPLLHLRNGTATRANVRDFSMLPDGTWQLSNVWLAPEKP